MRRAAVSQRQGSLLRRKTQAWLVHQFLRRKAGDKHHGIPLSSYYQEKEVKNQTENRKNEDAKVDPSEYGCTYGTDRLNMVKSLNHSDENSE